MSRPPSSTTFAEQSSSSSSASETLSAPTAGIVSAEGITKSELDFKPPLGFSTIEVDPGPDLPAVTVHYDPDPDKTPLFLVAIAPVQAQVLQKLSRFMQTYGLIIPRGPFEATPAFDLAKFLTVQAHVDFIEAIRAHLNKLHSGRYDKIGLLGHSTGSRLPPAYAKSHPDRTLGVIVAAAGFSLNELCVLLYFGFISF